MTGRSAGTVFRDFTMLMVLGFVAMVIWLLPHINPPESAADYTPPGNVVVAIHWPEGDTDVDMWVTGPGQSAPVGYSNKSGELFNLLRDDLGKPDEERNYENGYSRGIPAGEYIVNVHCYRCPEVPVEVDVEVQLSGDDESKGMTPVATTTLELDRNGDERTALRFRLDANGEVEPDSLNSVFRPLREAGASS
ncbi:MAG: hypothetical protein ACOC71_04130 [Hyphomicrobiales bacterium]